MNPKHIEWCRTLFGMLNDGGIWAVPGCGLVFRKIGDELVLIDRMPHAEEMPISAEELQRHQDSEYENNRRHFEAAGITVRRMQ